MKGRKNPPSSALCTIAVFVSIFIILMVLQAKDHPRTTITFSEHCMTFNFSSFTRCFDFWCLLMPGAFLDTVCWNVSGACRGRGNEYARKGSSSWGRVERTPELRKLSSRVLLFCTVQHQWQRMAIRRWRMRGNLLISFNKTKKLQRKAESLL